jgi:hypothetical protein
MLDFKELPDDGIAFEQLIRELLLRSEFEVHWTGVGPDGGRDLVVIERAVGQLAPFERKWLVSCKHNAHSGKSVALEDVRDVVDSCSAVDASGFLLACSTQPSSSVVRRLDEIRSKGQILTKYWDSVEIEKRFDTPATFPLISLFFPISAAARPWRIYNTDSPSYWAANYKDYFIYLTSRDANTFPSLNDIELIVGWLESIKLPEGENWERHYIRPRAVYFDNKNEQYIVFADYLYPRGKDREVVLPRAINEVLHDGAGLHSDGTAEWYITQWDIRYVETHQVSDHFHLDHQDYYKPFMNEYRSGMSRNRFFLGDMARWPINRIIT